ncbi:uncharacterized protein SPPG_07096 [Spizellomyces punctatus DAOM BR117]|uniref:Uncharacterized protein n=1 Tax=Spizellomyces punctatus (strain DAOM BR117) TaxID=645134 RepID=A0A0L0HAC4_SPIPD|nr:uncharacterized protein SPPG_07096 [Spizellomyces punctatus DAOM BR117]KNC97628.1 hypothetical protein SPPG_07096 [Spizellomyces punctatus DAOM BR117]|eukprot:XP_016605668.1 hypothetical protein SPPG_07096 [Spizellomyces punctatus DAOM BR117]
MSAPPPLPPRTKNGTSNNDHPTLSPFYATSLSSYQSACQREAELYEQGHVAEAYQIFQAFVEEEGKKRRQFYGRGLEKEPRAVNKVEAVRFEGDEAQKERVPSDPSTPTLDVKEGQGAHANVADTTALTNSDDRSSVNKEQQNENPEPRPTLPASQDLASALDRAALLTSDPPTDLVDLMNKVQEATTQACTLSNLDRRWEFQSGEDSITQNLDSEASQRREANNNALKAFYGRSDWSGANTLQEAFEQNEKQIRLQNERDALERWRLGYFVPTLDRLAQTSQEIEALYANLKSDPKAIHHILTTLQRTHDTILTLISTTHDVNADWQRRGTSSPSLWLLQPTTPGIKLVRPTRPLRLRKREPGYAWTLKSMPSFKHTWNGSRTLVEIM